MVEELLEEDGLTIMAAGLTWQKVAAVLLRLQMERRRDPAQRGVMLVLGCKEWQRSMLKEELLRMDRQQATIARLRLARSLTCKPAQYKLFQRLPLSS
jgi:hypothetical protein